MTLYSGGLKKIVIIVNTAKNLIKISPLIDKFARYYDFLEPIILCTGQPFSKAESAYLFEEMSLPRPNIYLNVKNGSHSETTSNIMMEADKCFAELCPDMIVVTGGSDAALGTAISAARNNVKIAHIEAGLRCPGIFSSTDINRKMVDSISDIFFVTDCNSHTNIKNEGNREENIFFVGNIMVDALNKYLPLAKNSRIPESLGLVPNGYALLTIHRKSNTTSYENFKGIISATQQIAEKTPVALVCYPRIKEDIEKFGLGDYFDGKKFQVYESCRYPDFLSLEKSAAFLMTDSGTMQVESSVLGIPCLTLRKNTEWIVTVKEGTNTIVGPFPEKIIASAEMIMSAGPRQSSVPKYWDGCTAERIADVIAKSFVQVEPGTRKIKTTDIFE
jgi:UDP-N-acetylglucosamine 2-epimerase (non-hydrolysing)